MQRNRQSYLFLKVQTGFSRKAFTWSLRNLYWNSIKFLSRNSSEITFMMDFIDLFYKYVQICALASTRYFFNLFVYEYVQDKV